jgi:hypothetical protein
MTHIGRVPMKKNSEDKLREPMDGKIRLSLIDIVYGLVIGYSLNFFVDRDPSSLTPFLFLLVMSVIICDWLFVHKPYWRKSHKYTNGPFVLDICILFVFACMIRFAAKPPHSGVLIAMGTMFLLYAWWDIVFGEYLIKGRSWKRDLCWDLLGAVAFFLLWKYMDVNWMASRVLYFDLPDWIGIDIDLRWWIVVAFLLYIFLGPHKWADWLKSRFSG